MAKTKRKFPQRQSEQPVKSRVPDTLKILTNYEARGGDISLVAPAVSAHAKVKIKKKFKTVAEVAKQVDKVLPDITKRMDIVNSIILAASLASNITVHSIPTVRSLIKSGKLTKTQKVEWKVRLNVLKNLPAILQAAVPEPNDLQGTTKICGSWLSEARKLMLPPPHIKITGKGKCRRWNSPFSPC